ncbi:MAG: hypothetical protein RRA45_08170 [Saccharolobus sp.]|uniref:hypothetical protein n=1 Tax=Saccharolobus sp. TaxID=2100761 RepID=UPI0028CE5E87|nr:hypothetical protein [Saccharolobus sp.]MDT7862174.1 hypothetical protein [Saccharolobus sp.]
MSWLIGFFGKLRRLGLGMLGGLRIGFSSFCIILDSVWNIVNYLFFKSSGEEAFVL